MAVWEKIAWKKREKGKQDHLLYKIRAIGKNIKWEKGKTKFFFKNLIWMGRI